jgi:hypothetical protein
MCNVVIINKGEKEIGTPAQFLEHFEFLPEKWEAHDILEMDCCLCQCDIEETFLVRDIPFKMDCGDFYVGDLDEVKGD